MSKAIDTFKRRLAEAGAEILGTTNPYEVLRFKTAHGVGVIYKGKRGETWNAEAIAARNHLDKQKGSLAPVKVKGRRTSKATVAGLLERDGGDCFFCGNDLDGDITVEHLVSIAHGGPNHMTNLFLAHAECNQKAGHLSAPEKVKLALETRLSTSNQKDDE